MSCSVCGRKSPRATCVAVDAVEAGEEDLQRALEELDLALDAEEVALLEGAELVLGGVPQAGADGAGAVAQLELQEEVALAIGAELLVGDQVDFVESFAVGEELDTAARHAWAFQKTAAWGLAVAWRFAVLSAVSASRQIVTLELRTTTWENSL